MRLRAIGWKRTLTRLGLAVQGVSPAWPRQRRRRSLEVLEPREYLNATPVLVLSGSSVVEGGLAQFVLTISPAPIEPVAVTYQTFDQSATAPADYAAGQESFAISAGQTTASFWIQTSGDTEFEADETFAVSLTSATGASIGTGYAVGTIIDDDYSTSTSLSASVYVSVSSAGTVMEGQAASFPVSLSETATAPVTVGFTTGAGTAQPGTDYSATSGEVIFNAGEQFKYVHVPTFSDAIYDPDEAFSLSLTYVQGATLAETNATAYLQDDGSASTSTSATISISLEDFSATEGGSASVAIHLSSPAPAPITLYYDLYNGSATSPHDFIGLAGTLSLETGVSLAYLPITLTNDANNEPTEYFSVALTGVNSSASVSVLSGAAIGTIYDDDAFTSSGAQPTVTLSSAGSVVEGQWASFAVSLSSSSTESVTVELQASGTGTNAATYGDDFVPLLGPLVFAPGQTLREFYVQTIDDALVEPDESYAVSVTAINGASAGTTYAEGVITDNDASSYTSTTSMPVVSIGGASGVEGSSLYFPVTLSTTLEVPLVVYYLTGHGTASSPQDFAGQAGAITLLPGQSSGEIAIPTVDDSLYEGNEDFSVSLSWASADVTTGVSLGEWIGLGTITDNDTSATTSPQASVQVSFSNLISEGETASITLTLDSLASTAAQVTLNTSNLSALLGEDYSLPFNPTVTLSPSAPIQVVAIPTIEDMVHEADESFSISLSSDAPLSPNGGTITIQDNDASATTLETVTVGMGNAYATEGSSLVFPITISPAPSEPVILYFSWYDATAQAYTDFEPVTATLYVSAGASYQELMVATYQDAAWEFDESFYLSLTYAASAHSVSLQSSSAMGTIYDDDLSTPPSVSVTFMSTVYEGQGVPVELNLSSSVGHYVEVTIATYAGAAEEGIDYQGGMSTITFAPWQTQQISYISTYADGVDEPDEGFYLSITSASATILMPPGDAVTILDADLPPSVAVQPWNGSVHEGNLLGFLIELQGSSSETVSVDLQTFDGGASGGEDFTPYSGTLYFAPGETVKFVHIPVLVDSQFESWQESFTLQVTGVTHAVVAAGSATGVILADLPTVRLQVIDDQVSEQYIDTGEVLVVRDWVTDEELSVAYTLSGTATNGVDYATLSGIAVIPANQAHVLLKITPIDDGLPEQDPAPEALTITLTDLEEYGLSVSSEATIEIWDQIEVVGVPSNETATGAQGEDGGGAGGAFDITIDEDDTAIIAGIRLVHKNDPNRLYVVPEGAKFTYRAVTTDGLASSPADYEAVDTIVSFVEKSSTATFPIKIKEDNLREPDIDWKEYFTVSVSDFEGFELFGPNTGTIRILDDDKFVQIKATKSSAMEFDESQLSFNIFRDWTEGATDVTYYIPGLSTPPTGVEATYKADFQGQDLTYSPSDNRWIGKATIPAGQSSVDIDFTVLADEVTESFEFFQVTLWGTSNGKIGPRSTTQGLIFDCTCQEFTVPHNDLLLETSGDDWNRKGVLRNTLLEWEPNRDLDGDGDFDTHSISSVYPGEGKLTIAHSGAFAYLPPRDFVGEDAFKYTVGAQSSAKVYIDPESGQRFSEGEYAFLALLSIAGPDLPLGSELWEYETIAIPNSGCAKIRVTNSLPNAPDGSATVNHDMLLAKDYTAGVLSGVTDAEADVLKVKQRTAPQHGALQLFENGAYTYKPNPGYLGTDYFEYELFDGFEVSHGQPDIIGKITLTVINSAPVATTADRSFSIPHDSGTLYINKAQGLTYGAYDIEGDIVTASVLTSPANGTLTLNPSGAFFYKPNAGYFGNDYFTYELSDGIHKGSSGKISLQITNATPHALDHNLSVVHDGLLSGVNLLFGTNAGDNDLLRARVTYEPSSGELTLDPSGALVYRPAIGFVGDVTFKYAIDDFSAAASGTKLSTSNDATVTIKVTNTPPMAVDHNHSLTQGATLDVLRWEGLLLGATDGDGDRLTPVLVDTSNAHGQFDLRPSGAFVYTPEPGFAGLATIQYTLDDGLTSGNLATVTFLVLPQVNTYEASNDIYATDAAGLVVSHLNGLLVNDNGPSLSEANVTILSQPSQGQLIATPAGAFRYIPVPGAAGTDTFTYRVVDNAGFQSNVATVTLTFAPNAAPIIASVDIYDLLWGGSLIVQPADGLLQNASDANGDHLVATLDVGPVHGEVKVFDSGAFIYTPDDDFVGIDSFSIRPFDGVSYGEAMTVAIDVRNTPPTASNASYTVGHASTGFHSVKAANYGSLVEVSLASALAGELHVNRQQGVLPALFDEDGDALSVVLVSGPATGNLTLQPDGAFTYIPAAGYVGDVTFVFEVTDGIATSDAATVTIYVTNDAPVAQPDMYSLSAHGTLAVGATGGVLKNDVDEDGDAFTASLVSGAAHGVLHFGANGSFTYSPHADYVGNDSFTYQVSDGISTSEPVTVTLTVGSSASPASNGPGLSPPIASDDLFEVSRNRGLVRLNGGVLANDTFDPQRLASAELVSGAIGNLSLAADGTLVYAKTAAVLGNDSFTYRLFDGQSYSAPATVTLEFTNATPVAKDLTYEATAGETLAIPAWSGVVASGEDADRDALTASLVAFHGPGALTLQPDGSFSYQAPADFAGSTSFEYQLSDGYGGSANGTVTIAIGGVNTAPTIGDTALFTSVHDRALLVGASEGLLRFATDHEGDALSVAIFSQPQHGQLFIHPGGGFWFLPEEGFYGSDSFEYVVSDDQYTSAPATATLSILNTAPIDKVQHSFSTSHDRGLFVRAAAGLLSTATDEEDDRLGFVVVDQPQFGALQVFDDGAFSYRPAAGYVGADAFTYQIVDDAGAVSPIYSVGLSVANSLPTQTPLSYTIHHDRPLIVPTAEGILRGLVDAEGDRLTIQLVGEGPAHGKLDLRSEGGFVYTPNASYVGEDSFAFTFSDGLVTSGEQVVTLQVTNDLPSASKDVFTISHNKTLLASSWTSPARDDNWPGQLVAYDLLSNDSADLDDVKVTITQSPGQGDFDANEQGQFVYTPPRNFVGDITFKYRIADSLDASDPAAGEATVTISVINQTPTVSGFSFDVARGSTYIAKESYQGLLSVLSDADGDELTVELDQGPSYGTVDLRSDGTFTYTPYEGTYVGKDEFTFKASDGFPNSSALGTVKINITNAAPVAREETFYVRQGGRLELSPGARVPWTEVARLVPDDDVVSGSLLGNDTDANGDALEIVVPELLPDGLSLTKTGGLVFNASESTSGPFEFSYQVTDQIDSTTSVLRIYVVPNWEDDPEGSYLNALRQNLYQSKIRYEQIATLNEAERKADNHSATALAAFNLWRTVEENADKAADTREQAYRDQTFTLGAAFLKDDFTQYTAWRAAEDAFVAKEDKSRLALWNAQSVADADYAEQAFKVALDMRTKEDALEAGYLHDAAGGYVLHQSTRRLANITQQNEFVIAHGNYLTAEASALSTFNAQVDSELDVLESQLNLLASNRDLALATARTMLDDALRSADGALLATQASAQTQYASTLATVLATQQAVIAAAEASYLVAIEDAADDYAAHTPDENATNPWRPNDNASYQAAVLQAQSIFNSAVAAANAIYEAAIDAARTQLTTQLNGATATRDAAQAAARTAYRTAATAAQDQLVDNMDDALTAHALARSVARADYQALADTARFALDGSLFLANKTLETKLVNVDADGVAQLNAAHGDRLAAIKAARFGYDDELFIAEVTRQQSVDTAYDKLRGSLADGAVSFAQDSASALKTFETARWTAFDKRDGTVTAARTKHDAALWSAWLSQNTATNKSQETYLTQMLGISNSYFDTESKASATRNVADLDSRYELFGAYQSINGQLLIAEEEYRGHMLVLGGSETQHKFNVQAYYAKVAKTLADQNFAYERRDHLAAFLETMHEAHVAQSKAAAEAQFTRDKAAQAASTAAAIAIATATSTLDTAELDAIQIETDANLDAGKAYANAVAFANTIQNLAASAVEKTYRQAVAAADHTLSTTEADAQATLVVAEATADADFEVATQTIQTSLHADSMLAFSTWSHESASLQQGYASNLAAHVGAYTTQLRAAEATLASTAFDTLSTYQAAEQLAWNIAYGSLTDAEVAYQNAAAGALASFAGAEASAAAAWQTAHATAEATMVTTNAQSRSASAQQWAASENTFFAQYVAALEAANAAYVSDVRDELAASAGNIASASAARHVSLATAKAGFTADEYDARLAYSDASQQTWSSFSASATDAIGDLQTAIAFAQNALQAALGSAGQSLIEGLAAADRNQQLTTAEAIEQISMIEQLAQANWTTGSAALDVAEAAAFAGLNTTYANAMAAALHTQELAVADAEEARSDANSFAQAAHTDAIYSHHLATFGKPDAAAEVEFYKAYASALATFKTSLATAEGVIAFSEDHAQAIVSETAIIASVSYDLHVLDSYATMSTAINQCQTQLTALLALDTNELADMAIFANEHPDRPITGGEVAANTFYGFLDGFTNGSSAKLRNIMGGSWAYAVNVESESYTYAYGAGFATNLIVTVLSGGTCGAISRAVSLSMGTLNIASAVVYGYDTFANGNYTVENALGMLPVVSLVGGKVFKAIAGGGCFVSGTLVIVQPEQADALGVTTELVHWTGLRQVLWHAAVGTILIGVAGGLVVARTCRPEEDPLPLGELPATHRTPWRLRSPRVDLIAATTNACDSVLSEWKSDDLFDAPADELANVDSDRVPSSNAWPYEPDDDPLWLVPTTCDLSTRSAPPISRTKTAVVPSSEPKTIPQPQPPAAATSPRSRAAFAWLTAFLLLAAALAGGSRWFDGARVSASLTPQLPLASDSQTAARTDVLPIEQIRVGTNVLASHPLGEQEFLLGDEVDPFTWKRLKLTANKADGSWAEVELLRPDWWLALHEAREGGTVHIDVPECGIDGEAVVEAISACPPFAPPLPGYRTVTGTFKHHSAQVVDLQIDDLAEPIGTTANHPFYSLDRSAFIRADELQPRERLHSLHGETRVVSITPRATQETVYNLEVQVDHVYHVTHSGVLVHNGKFCPPGGTGSLFDEFGLTPGRGLSLHVPSAPNGRSYITYIFTEGNEIVYVGRASGPGSPLQVLQQRLSKGHDHFSAEMTARIVDVQSSLLASQGAEEVFMQGYRQHGALLRNIDEALSFRTDRVDRSMLKIEAFIQDLRYRGIR